MTAAPQDLHQLLALLEPRGWRKRESIVGLWRDVGVDKHGRRTQFLSPLRPGVVEVYGAGLRWEGALSDVVECLKKMGAA